MWTTRVMRWRSTSRQLMPTWYVSRQNVSLRNHPTSWDKQCFFLTQTWKATHLRQNSTWNFKRELTKIPRTKIRPKKLTTKRYPLKLLWVVTSETVCSTLRLTSNSSKSWTAQASRITPYTLKIPSRSSLKTRKKWTWTRIKPRQRTRSSSRFCRTCERSRRLR